MLLFQTLYPLFQLTGLWKSGCSVLVKILVSSELILGFSFGAVSVLMLGDFIALSLGFGRVLNINNGSTLLYDGAIFGVTVYYTWTLVKLRLSITEVISGTSLGYLILKQGIITDNVLRDHSPVSSVSMILILRFFLDLRERNAHPNGTSQTRDLEPCSSFRAAMRKFSNAIIEDLGDPEDGSLFASQTTHSGTVSGQALRPSAGEAENNDSTPAVNLEEFPWAAGRLDHIEGETGNRMV
ncbi:hypothetical protein BU17DRAFT_66507 [Hysterangium stoloniferum]|nr:hypothetical protein BU17DRAFT_66507 [Hysterangium stoloniferum]